MMRWLCLEHLERRLLLNGAPPFADHHPLQLTIDPSDFDPHNIMVRFRGNGQLISGSLPQGTSLGREFSLVEGLHSIRIDQGVWVKAALAAYRSLPNVLYAEPIHLLAWP